MKTFLEIAGIILFTGLMILFCRWIYVAVMATDWPEWVKWLLLP